MGGPSFPFPPGLLSFPRLVLLGSPASSTQAPQVSHVSHVPLATPTPLLPSPLMPGSRLSGRTPLPLSESLSEPLSESPGAHRKRHALVPRRRLPGRPMFCDFSAGREAERTATRAAAGLLAHNLTLALPHDDAPAAWCRAAIVLWRCASNASLTPAAAHAHYDAATQAAATLFRATPRTAWPSAWSALPAPVRQTLALRNDLRHELALGQLGTLTDTCRMDEHHAVLHLLKHAHGRAAVRPALDELYLFDLSDSLRRWARPRRDVPAQVDASLTPSIVWRMVRAAAGLATTAGAPSDVGELADLPQQRSFDTAALLYFEARDDYPWQTAARNGQLSVEVLRRAFAQAWQQEDAQAQLSSALFARGGTPGAVYFDGLALRGAAGLSFEQIADLPQLASVAAYQQLDAAARDAALRRKFAEMGESTAYPIGSPQQSLASITMRVLQERRLPSPAAARDDAELLNRFRAVRRHWIEARDYPVDPGVVFALHLARANGVPIVGRNWYRRTLREAVQPAFARLAQLGPGGLAPSHWLDQQLATWNDGDTPWYQRNQTTIDNALAATFDRLREIPGTEGFGLAPLDRRFDSPIPELAELDPFARACVELTLSELNEGVLPKEMIVADGWDEVSRAALDYANLRMTEAFGHAAAFTRAAEAVRILRSYGLSESEIFHPRMRVLATDNMNLAQTQYATAIATFLTLAARPGATNRFYFPDGRSVQPRQLLQAAEQRFNAALPTHPWVVARAHAALRQGGRAVTKGAVRIEAARIAADYQTETENWRNTKTGAMTAFSFLPIAYPAYSIGDGIYHHDWVEAVGGVFNLLLDIVLLPDGESAGSRPRVSPRRAAGEIPLTDMDVGISMRRTASAETTFEVLQDLDLHSGIESFDEDMIQVHIDPHDLVLPDLDIPAAVRPLAAQLRAGATDLSWEGHALGLVSNEGSAGRVVLLEAEGGKYRQLDWVTKRPLQHAPLLMRDAQGTLRSDLRLRGGGRKRLTLSTDGAVGRRMTVMRARALLGRATDAGRRDFATLYRRHIWIDARHGATVLDVRGRLAHYYQHSPLFRRLMNGYDTRTVQPRTIRFRLGYRTQPFLEEHRNGITTIHLPTLTELGRTTFMTARGVEICTPDNVLLHEMNHALTGEPDPGLLQGLTERGPIVFLADRMVFEGGSNEPQRLTYITHDAPAPAASQQKTLSTAAHLMELENETLDRIINAGYTWSEDDLLMGVPMQQRVGVSETVRILAAAQAKVRPAVPGYADFKPRITRHFRYRAVRDGPRAQRLPLRSELRNFFDKAYRRSPIFRQVFDAFEPLNGEPWTIRTHSADASTCRRGCLAYTLNRSTRTIDMYANRPRYLSDQGMIQVERERRWMDAMLDALTGAATPTGRAVFTSRGAVPRLTDVIFDELGMTLPTRLVYGLAGTEEMTLQKELLMSRSTVRRIAEIEDRYLESRHVPPNACALCDRARDFLKNLRPTAHHQGNVLQSSYAGAQPARAESAVAPTAQPAQAR